MSPRGHACGCAHAWGLVRTQAFGLRAVCSLCPPRRWSDAGVGIGMLRGISLLSANLYWMIPLDSLTIGYLILDDSLGVPYYRLINVIGLPFLKIKKLRDPSLKIKKFRVISCACFDRYEMHIQAFVDFINGK